MRWIHKVWLVKLCQSILVVNPNDYSSFSSLSVDGYFHYTIPFHYQLYSFMNIMHRSFYQVFYDPSGNLVWSVPEFSPCAWVYENLTWIGTVYSKYLPSPRIIFKVRKWIALQNLCLVVLVEFRVLYLHNTHAWMPPEIHCGKHVSSALIWPWAMWWLTWRGYPPVETCCIPQDSCMLRLVRELMRVRILETYMYTDEKLLHLYMNLLVWSCEFDVKNILSGDEHRWCTHCQAEDGSRQEYVPSGSGLLRRRSVLWVHDRVQFTCNTGYDQSRSDRRRRGFLVRLNCNDWGPDRQSHCWGAGGKTGTEDGVNVDIVAVCYWLDCHSVQFVCFAT